MSSSGKETPEKQCWRQWPKEHLTEAQRVAIIARYEAGVPKNKIAAEFECSTQTVGNTIRRWLEYRTVKSRINFPPRSKLTEAQRASVIAKYKEGGHPKDLAKEFDCGLRTIYRIAGIVGKPRNCLTEAQREDILTKHNEGARAKDLAEEFGCSLRGVYYTIQQGPARPKTKLTDAQREYIIAKYEAGVPPRTLAAEFRDKRPTVAYVIQYWKKRGTVELKHPQGPFLDSMEQRAAIIARRAEGATYDKIAKEFGCDSKTIRMRCKEGLVQRKPRGGLSKKLDSTDLPSSATARPDQTGLGHDKDSSTPAGPLPVSPSIQHSAFPGWSLGTICRTSMTPHTRHNTLYHRLWQGVLAFRKIR